MGRKRKYCPKCGEKLENIYHKSLRLNVPDAKRGRGLCPQCGKGCVTFDVNIFHNDKEKVTHGQTEEQKYGLCCACGQRGDHRLWWEKPRRRKKAEPLPSYDEMLEEYRRATPEERALAEAILGRDPFAERDDDAEEDE